VDAGHHDEFVFLSVRLQQGNDLQASHRVKSAGGLVEKKNVWCGNQLARNADTSLLASRYPLADGCADQSISLLLETETVDQSLDPATLFILQNRSDALVIRSGGRDMVNLPGE
jgi:hypothetical protein